MVSSYGTILQIIAISEKGEKKGWRRRKLKIIIEVRNRVDTLCNVYRIPPSDHPRLFYSTINVEFYTKSRRKLIARNGRTTGRLNVSLSCVHPANRIKEVISSNKRDAGSFNCLEGTDWRTET